MNTAKQTIDLKDTSGFGLLSTVIAMGIAMILIMGILDILSLAANVQRGVQIKTDRTAFMANLTNILSQDPTCTPSLKGNDVTKPVIMYDPATATKAVAQTGMRFPEWNIHSLELQNQQLIDNGMKLYSADVVITLNNLVRLIGITPTTTKQIATIYYTAHEGTITHCFGATNWPLIGKNYCATMGGSWSDSTIECTLPTVASAAAIASNSAAESNPLTVAQVVNQTTNSTDVAVNNTTAAEVLTGVDHAVGKKAN